MELFNAVPVLNTFGTRYNLIQFYTNKHLGHGNSEQHPELTALMDRGRELQIPKATLERALTLSLVSSINISIVQISDLIVL